MLWVTSVTVRSPVVSLVDDTVGIEVNDIVVTNHNLRIVLLACGCTIEFIIGLDVAIVDE